MIVIRRLSMAATAALVLLAVPLSATAAPDDDLNQVIDPNQSQGIGRVVRDAGHVDFGPTLNTGEWKIQIHDDTAVPSYWRNLEDVSLHVTDDAILTVPDDPNYEFLQVEPGTDVWVIPQNRNNDVIWAGWNTQEPNVLEQLSLGTNLSILGVQGPGNVTVYLQSGNFGEPDVLWTSNSAFPQTAFIERNAHAHANWIFTEPGIYLVEMQFDAQLTDGSEVSARDVLRLAIGSETDPNLAFDAVYEAPVTETAETDSSEPAEEVTEPEQETDLTIVIIFGVIGAVAVALVCAIVIGIVAARRAKKRATEDSDA